MRQIVELILTSRTTGSMYISIADISFATSYSHKDSNFFHKNHHSLRHIVERKINDTSNNIWKLELPVVNDLLLKLYYWQRGVIV